MIKFLTLSVSLLLFTSCSHKINLCYEPVWETCERNQTSVIIKDFEDCRDTLHVGSWKNIYGVPVVKLTADDVAGWVANALRLEMAKAGYAIADRGEYFVYEIEGRLIKASMYTYFTYEGEMTVEIVVKENGQEIFKKVYKTEEDNGMVWMVSDSSCAKTLTLNLQEICRQFIGDFNRFKQKHEMVCLQSCSITP